MLRLLNERFIIFFPWCVRVYLKVLWPECGWHAVSLTDLITAASVKKVYRKATLCVHPDKVQQKGATIQQKYIAEKVFDLLKVSIITTIIICDPKINLYFPVRLYAHIADTSFNLLKNMLVILSFKSKLLLCF